MTSDFFSELLAGCNKHRLYNSVFQNFKLFITYFFVKNCHSNRSDREGRNLFIII